MTTPQPKLTDKQNQYLSLLQQAKVESISIVQIAKQNNIDPSLLYAARKQLRAKGLLASEPASKFHSLSIPSAASSAQHIELKTQLPNGQPIWLSVPAGQLVLTLKALSA